MTESFGVRRNPLHKDGCAFLSTGDHGRCTCARKRLQVIRELQVIGVQISSAKAQFDTQVAVEKDMDAPQAHALAVQVALDRFRNETTDPQPDDPPRVVATQFRGTILLPIS